MDDQQYERLGELGRGGMGVVYRARDRAGREVALKTLTEADPARSEALRREVRALSRLDHPGIVRVLDEGVDEVGPWFAMPLLRGIPLHEAWSQTTEEGTATMTLTAELDELPASGGASPAGSWQERMAPLGAIAAALAHLHAHRLVHGDLKPSNVLVVDGAPVLVDFGLAARLGLRETAQTLGLTSSGMGSPGYIAPERLAGHPADARADLYALGCMLYEALAGHRPFAGQPPITRSGQVLTPSPLPSHIPKSLAALTLALLAPRPEDRPASTAAVARALGVHVDDVPLLHRAPLTGREHEREVLRSRVHEASEGRGSATVLVGVAGSGKTRLALEAVAEARLRSLPTVAGACTPSEGASPVAPFTALLTRAVRLSDPAELREHGPVLRPWVPALDALAEREDWPTLTPLPADLARAALVEAVLAYAALACTEPLVCIVDDAQWADPMTADILAALRERLDTLALCLVLTSREPLTDWPSLTLDPLDDEAQRAVIARMLGRDDLDPTLVAWCTRIAAGNPFLLTEAVRVAVSGESRPDDANGVLARRIASVDADATRLLDVVAVAGDACTPAALRAAELPEERLLDATRALEDADLIVPTTRGPAFAHGLLRDVAYERLGAERAVSLHRDVASALDEVDAPAAERAHHWDRADAPEQAWALYRRASNEALAGFAVDEAERCLRRALTLEVSEAQHADTRAELVDRVLVPTGHLKEAREILAPHAETERDSRALLAWADVMQLQGEYEAAEAVLERALAIAGDDRELTVRAWTLRAEQAHRRGRSEEARTAAANALAAAEQAPSTEKVVASWYTAASVFRAAGAADDALAAAEKLLDQGRRLGSARMEAFGLELSGLLALDRGDLDVVADSLTRAVQAFRKLRDKRHEALCLGNLAGAKYYRGELAECAELLEQAASALRALGDLRSVAGYVQNLGAVYELREDWHRARTAYAEAADILLGLGDAEAASCLTFAARVERLAGSPRDTVAALLDRAEAMELDRVNRLSVTLERVAFIATYDGDGRAALADAEAMLEEMQAVPSFLQSALDDARKLVHGA
ncbi:MAG: hypothetical protein EP330_01180 [Deltaproteobacteria bacterium]|nr:MAG: hypothetical protein EP330_01180 [Deltaproteobacteria bacterium]